MYSNKIEKPHIIKKNPKKLKLGKLGEFKIKDKN